MEWYWILILSAVFLGVVGLLVYLGRNGIVSNELMKAIRTMVSAFSDVFDWLSQAMPSPTTQGLDKACELLEVCVRAAENMWYNGEISADERYHTCVQLFNEAILVYGVELPAGYALIMDSIIRAVCESMGHHNVTKADLKEMAEASIALTGDAR